MVGGMRLATLLLALCTASAAHAQTPERGTRTEQNVIREGELWLSPILRVRERGEVRLSNYEYQLGLDEPVVDDFDRFRVEHRVWAGADARWRMFRAVLVLRDARRFGETGELASSTDLFQAFGEVAFDEGWLRVGRQEIRWGHQRLIGAAPWGAGISFDAVRGRVDLGGLSFDAFGAWLLNQPTFVSSSLPPQEHPGRLLFGLRAQAVVSPALVLEPTVLYRYDGYAGAGLGGLGGLAGVGAVDPHLGTGAIRAHGVHGGFFYDVEAMAQIGEKVEAGDIHLAFAGAGWAGYRFAGALGFELRGGGSFGTGPGDDVDLFDNLFPANHARYGIIDYASLANMGSAFLRVRVAPQGTKLAVWLDAHGFALPESQGPWRGQNGRLLGQSAANGEHLLGLELDLVANWRPSPAISVQGGYSVFLPGPAAENLGHDELSQFFYLMLDLRLP
ncbi:MAG: hypothetical protein EVA89_08900 [Sandaracinaceae bacterium]|nr:MAG: hypothetical protein EVA89_08900 [Sandaracinaceae bacterium]